MSSADFMTALYFNVMDQNPETWTRAKGFQTRSSCRPDTSPQCITQSFRGQDISPSSELGSFRKFGSRLQGHPSIRKGLPGVAQAAGSLGQGLSVAIGAALAKKADNYTHCVYVLCGDGETEEGQILEAAMFAAHHKADNLIAMTDWNGQQIDGTTEDVAGLGDLEAKWKAFGWRSSSPTDTT